MHGWWMAARLSLVGVRHTIKKFLHWERRKSKVNELSLSPFCVHSYSRKWAALKTPGCFGTTIFLHLPVCGSDLISQKCTQHHTSPEQSLTSLSIRATSCQAKKPPTLPRTYRERSGHLTNPHSSPTGGWLLLSKQSAMILLSQNHQPPPLTQQNKPKQSNSPLQHNTFGWKMAGFPKV